jgi:hypothetical protein
MKTDPQYVEGQKAKENFKQLATVMFNTPKPEGRNAIKKSAIKSSVRKSKSPDKN